MSEQAKDFDDAAVDWIFTRARRYPLLSAAQEQAIDKDKWHAVERLQQLFVVDEDCRTYLRQWALATLNNPPCLNDFTIREHYNLLRRELVDLLAGGAQREDLVRVSKYLARPLREKRDCSAITALKPPASLVVGLAETLAGEDEPRGVAAALQYWQQFWPTRPEAAQRRMGAPTRDSMHAHLADYYTARGKLVNHNLRLVFSIAGRATGRGVPFRDLIQNSVPGLIRAAEKFQHQQGYRFSTYAYNWINQCVRQTIEEQRGIVRYPAGVNEKIARMYRERMHLLNATGHEPDLRTLAQRLEMKPEALQQLQQVGNLSLSLDAQPTGETDGLSLGDTLAVGPFDPTPGAAEQASLNRCLMQRLAILEPLEQRIVIRRWGLDEGPPLTRAEVAVQMQVSAEWVRQLENSALAKLRNDEGIAQAYRDHQGDER